MGLLSFVFIPTCFADFPLSNLLHAPWDSVSVHWAPRSRTAHLCLSFPSCSGKQCHLAAAFAAGTQHWDALPCPGLLHFCTGSCPSGINPPTALTLLGTKAAGEVQSAAAEHRCARQAEQKGVMWADSRTSPPWFSSALHVRCIGNVGCFPFQWNKTMKILGRRTTMLVKTLSLRRAVFSDDSLSFQLSLVI